MSDPWGREGEVKTPQTHPDHHTVGHLFAGFGRGVGAQTQIFFCDSYDPRIGYWMTNIKDPAERTNISERAVGRTWFEVLDEGDHYWVTNWGVRVPKEATENPPRS